MENLVPGRAQLARKVMRADHEKFVKRRMGSENDSHGKKRTAAGARNGHLLMGDGVVFPRDFDGYTFRSSKANAGPSCWDNLTCSIRSSPFFVCRR
jgi:hypothetical protein